MKNKWRKLMAAFCAASMLMTLPGVSVYAAEPIYEDVSEDFEATPDEVDKNEDILEEDIIFEEPEISAEAVEPSEGDISSTELSEDPAEIIDPAEVEDPYPEEQGVAEITEDQSEENGLSVKDLPGEELVGATTYTVGNGVFAEYDSAAGSIVLSTPTGGTLWADWLERAGINRRSVKLITVARRTESFRLKKVKLPADSNGYESGYTLFGGLENLTKLDLGYFDTSNVTSMKLMFCDCNNLATLDLSGFDTSKVTDMSGMFEKCYELKTLDLSGFNTSKVTNMYGMFYYCNNLTSLNLKGWDTSNVTDMGMMFCMCESLKTLDMSGFNTSKVTNMFSMFNSCLALTSLNLRSFNTINVTDMEQMFAACESLKSLDVSSFKTSNVKKMRNMFMTCTSLTKLDLKGFDTSKLNETRGMFAYCKSLTSLDLRSFRTANVELMSYMFEGCGKLKYLDLGSFDMSKVRNAEGMFKDCNALEILITPKNRKNTSECYFSHTMYDRNGKKYDQLPVNEAAKVLGKTKELAASVFIDVRDPSHAYYNAIYWAVEKGITKGYSDGTFGIDRSCTRGEMMMFLWRYAGKPEPKPVSKSPFKDVPKTHTFYKAILWGSQQGITKGYSDGTFGINRNVTRGESMMFLWRLKGKPLPNAVWNSPFEDVPKTHVFFKAILWGYQNGVTTGYKTGPKAGTFGVDENCTRGQIVTFLYRARNL